MVVFFPAVGGFPGGIRVRVTVPIAVTVAVGIRVCAGVVVTRTLTPQREGLYTTAQSVCIPGPILAEIIPIGINWDTL